MDILKDMNTGVWTVMIVIILIAGLVMLIKTGAIQFRHLGHALKNTAGQAFRKKEKEKGAVTPFQACCTALAATVGTGNIAGVSGAIVAGGPGALFWIWICGLIGMGTKYAEVVLSLHYRTRNDKGDYVSGPMYYISRGMGKKWKWLAVLFAVFGSVASLGTGNMTQINSIASSVNSSLTSFFPELEKYATEISLALGLIVAAVTAVVVIGGIQSIGKMTEKVVPTMAFLYVTGALIVVFSNISVLGSVFADIFTAAFSPRAVLGAGAGFGIQRVITCGLERGVFSTEAGLGSAAMAHAASSEKDPVKQGFYGIFEVFLTTIICTLTGLAILSVYRMGDMTVAWGEAGDATQAIHAFSAVMGDRIGSLIIAVGLTLFAVSTIFAWSLYGTRCVGFLFYGKKIAPHARLAYQILYVAAIVVGSVLRLDVVWTLTDTLNALMALPNIIALVALSGVVSKLTKEYFAKRKAEKNS